MKYFTNHIYTLVYIAPPRNSNNGYHKCNELLNTVKKSLKQLHTLKEMKYKIYKKNLLKIKKTLQHGNIEINLN